jgi:hypothetical protein
MHKSLNASICSSLNASKHVDMQCAKG